MSNAATRVLQPKQERLSSLCIQWFLVKEEQLRPDDRDHAESIAYTSLTCSPCAVRLMTLLLLVLCCSAGSCCCCSSCSATSLLVGSAACALQWISFVSSLCSVASCAQSSAYPILHVAKQSNTRSPHNPPAMSLLGASSALPTAFCATASAVSFIVALFCVKANSDGSAY